MNLPEIQPLDYPLHLLFALALTLALAVPIEALLKWIAKAITIPRPARITDQAWSDLTSIPGLRGGRWIGHLERFLFFVSLIAGAPELVVAWLAFKVASKWEAWSNIYKIPEEIPGATKFESLLARTRWGSRTFQRSLVGTAANIAAAFIGLLAFHLTVLYNVYL